MIDEHIVKSQMLSAPISENSFSYLIVDMLIVHGRAILIAMIFVHRRSYNVDMIILFRRSFIMCLKSHHHVLTHLRKTSPQLCSER
jgi:hypothetical protein